MTKKGRISFTPPSKYALQLGDKNYAFAGNLDISKLAKKNGLEDKLTEVMLSLVRSFPEGYRVDIYVKEVKEK